MKRLLAWLHRLLWRRLYPRVEAGYEWLLQRSVRREFQDDHDFVVDAQWAMEEQTPRGAHIILWCSLISMAVLLLWAALAKLDEVTKGEGRVVPSREVQVIQSLDGGMVSQIAVRPGQTVKTGELLLRIDPTRFESSLNENRAQYLALQAKASRLRALAEGSAFRVPAEVTQEAPQLVEQERTLLLSKRAELDAILGVAHQQHAQRTQELQEVRGKRAQADEALALTQQEYNVTKPLAARGAVSEVDLLRLERDLSRYRGERDLAVAQIPRIEASIREASRKIQEAELNFRNLARQELSETTAKLSTLSAGSVALADRVRQSEIRSPVNGTVKQLLVNTVGGVVQPGKDIIEIVPSEDALLLETKILPKDIAFLRPGQRAQVKFTAYDFAIYGGLEATLETISADTVQDAKGNAFYIVRVRTKSSVIGHQRLPIIPGMVAEVDIITGKKSVLSYLLKPVLRARESAMRER